MEKQWNFYVTVSMKLTVPQDTDTETKEAFTKWINSIEGDNFIQSEMRGKIRLKYPSNADVDEISEIELKEVVKNA